MRILYIFPHPDDESFGPAGVINQQVKKGDEVYLLTLTKGGATKVRHNLGLTIEEMGEVRFNEMQAVQKVLGIKEMHILDYEDGGLAYLNPLSLEELITEWFFKLKPNIVITYPIHGGSGHHDHIAVHAAVNRAYYQYRPMSNFLKRLAFFTLPDSGRSMFLEQGVPRVTWTPLDKIGVIVKLAPEDIEAMKNALLCYETYQEMVKTTKVIEHIGDKVHFQLAGEFPNQPFTSLLEGIN